MRTNPRNILISGSSKGLGKELSNFFRDQGFNVITMGYETPGDVDIRCNLLDVSSLQLELKRLFEDCGAIDLLVCNAGGGKKPPEHYSEVETKKYFFEKNLETARNLLDLSEPYLKTPGASVIGISSIAALTTVVGAPPAYSEAKRNLNQLFRDRASKFAEKGIRVNLISPGNVRFKGSRWDEIAIENPTFVAELINDKVPLHKFISPDEIASAILYLSSNQARNITGVNLVIDGGQVL